MTTFNKQLSMRETIARFSWYALGIAALWGVAYLCFVLVGGVSKL